MFAKRCGPNIRQHKMVNPKAAFEARKSRLGTQDRSSGMYWEFFTPDTCCGNGKYKIEFWSYGACRSVEIYEQA